MGSQPLWNDDVLHRLIMAAILFSAGLLTTEFPQIWFPIWDGMPIAYFGTIGLFIILIRLSGELKFELGKLDQEEREAFQVAPHT